MSTSRAKPTDFAHFLPEILYELESISDLYLDTYNDSQAFVYLVAQTFESTDEDRFTFTDKGKDGGIDFFIQDTPTYSIYQCKCPDLEVLQGRLASRPVAPTFDQAPVEELIAAIEMLLDKSGSYDVLPAIKRLRGDFQRDYLADPESASLTATLAILGELTKPARAAFDSLRVAYSRKGVSLKLLEWQDLYHALHALDSPSDVDVTFDITAEDKSKDLLAHRDYCYVLAHAHDFYEAFRQHEWNLFDWNVRFQIPNSPINKRIVQSLKTRKGRKKFHHLNNGVLITCRMYEGVGRADSRITVRGAQIINGCQTVRAICEAYEDLSPEDQAEFRTDARVQVKIIMDTDPEFISELVVSTNNQNPMKPRNLRSNSNEQRTIQNGFRKLPHKWFYERKDGEWASLNTTSKQVRWFRRTDYVVPRDGKGRRQFRKIDNERLAKAWYSFIGYSGRALTGSVNYFEEDGKAPAYRTVFKSVPSPAFWSAFREPVFVSSLDYFDPETPVAYQYLLAYGIGEYIDNRRVSGKVNKQITIEKGVSEGVLKIDRRTGRMISSSDEISKYLNGDSEYNVNRMMAYMREVLIELYSFVLTLKYVSLDAVTCQRIVVLPHESQFFLHNFDAEKLPVHQDGSALLGVVYEFLKDCVKQFYHANEFEMRAAPRLRAYLAQRSTINKLRQLLVRRNESVRDWDQAWKPHGKTFLESLPDLP